MNGLFIYLGIIIFILAFIGYKIFTKKKREKQTYEEREDDVFYDAVKKIRRD